MTFFTKCGVIGGGSWGTALASTAHRAGMEVLLWSRSASVVSDINERCENSKYFPGVKLDVQLRATTDLAVMSHCDMLLLATPAQSLRAVSEQLALYIDPGIPLVICAKGIEQNTGKFMDGVLLETCSRSLIAVLSGPGFAEDVVRGRLAAVVLACADERVGRALCSALCSLSFRPYFSHDMIGVQFGGSVKNVLAIACGIARGKGLGASAHAALVSRGFAEMLRLGRAIGACSSTLMGLSGLGDLILTCGSPQSRNMALGMNLGMGMDIKEILRSGGSLREGIHTLDSVVHLARNMAIDMPIIAAVHDLVVGTCDVDEAIHMLLSRPLRDESHDELQDVFS